jgi:alpha-L-fucosidase
MYHDYSGEPADFAKTADPMGRVAPARWKAHYLARIKDLIDQHKPDCLYTDGGIPFEEYGLKTVAELYNVGPKDASGHPATVYFSKTETDCAVGTCVLDRERAVSDGIWPNAWQTDTCIGDWHYKSGQEYKSSKKVIDLLVDIVSKNGNLLLNFPLPASGELDKEEMKVIEGITSWMSVNSECIYSSRPWRVYGEGPSMKVVVPSSGFNESKKPDLGAQDIRFTTRGETLYAFVQGWPEGQVAIRSLGRSSQRAGKPVKDVRMLGRDIPLKFTQDSENLKVTLPAERPRTADIGIGLRIRFS